MTWSTWTSSRPALTRRRRSPNRSRWWWTRSRAEQKKKEKKKLPPPSGWRRNYSELLEENRAAVALLAGNRKRAGFPLDLFHGSPNRNLHKLLKFDELSELNQTLIALYTYLQLAYQNMYFQCLCWFSSNEIKGKIIFRKGTI